MIEYDLITYLEADATLDALLGAGVGGTKIMPVIPKEEPTSPYIVYSSSIGDNLDETLSEDRVQLNIFASSMLVCTNVRNRLRILLDKQDEIQDTTFYTASVDYFVYWSKLTAGDIIHDPDRRLYQCVMFFAVKYKNKV